ncbi:MAG: hypothetical protein F4W93_10650 [Dehalococcoidia bacterium]|nr:hypothetical protein [Dehalococcoidia bacterium]
MVYFIAGAAAGLIFMLAFVAVAPVMVFSLARDSDSWAGAFVRRVNPTTLMLGLVVVAYPIWTLFGGMLGLLYRLSTQVTPGSGLGSGNLAYTLALALAALMVAVPAAVLLRRVALGVVVIAMAFVGIYGWLLPFLVQVAER